MIALEQILVPVDFSDCSYAAIERAGAIGRRLWRALHLLHVVTDPIHATWAGYAPGTDFLNVVDELGRSARRQLEELVSRHGSSNVQDAVIATAWGDASYEILKYAATEHVDLIVCGTHGRSGLDRAMMGSVAERLVRLAPCPV